MFKLEAFKKLYLARLEEFSKTIFSPERIARQVDEVAAAIRPAVQEESESKLERFDKLVAGQTLERGGSPPFGGGRIKPIKPFTIVRAESVLEQLAGKSEGQTPNGGFPGGGRGPGRPGGSGLGMMHSRTFLRVLDQNKDASVTKAEFTEGFARLFDTWNTDKIGYLTLQQVRAGIEKDLRHPLLVPPRSVAAPATLIVLAMVVPADAALMAPAKGQTLLFPNNDL